MSSSPSLDSRLTDLETMAAHHERQIQDLSDMIRAQWKEIDFLKRQLEKAQNQLVEYMGPVTEGEAQAMSVAEIAAIEKPPHY